MKPALPRCATAPSKGGLFLARTRRAVEEELRRVLAASATGAMRRAAAYATLSGGHRWRAAAVMAAGAALRADASARCLPVACAVELAHASTLVLDDLPSMDDGRLRRGKPCVHLVCEAWATDLLPPLLLTMAYELCLGNAHATPEARLAAAQGLTRAALRMTAGQEDDLTHRDGEAEALMQCYRLKTGELFGEAARAGAAVCDAAPDAAAALYECGVRLGTAYQLADDIATRTRGPDELGKRDGRPSGRPDAVDLFGLEGALERERSLREQALAAVAGLGEAAEPLRYLVRNANCSGAAEPES